MAERHGIEIDYCPRCRGVWLNRGELDKIIARAGTGDDFARAAPRRSPPTYELRPRDDDGRDHRQRRARRRGLLGELFDFD
jgi:Zn-finger nucleic acid-binding protein